MDTNQHGSDSDGADTTATQSLHSGAAVENGFKLFVKLMHLVDQ